MHEMRRIEHALSILPRLRYDLIVMGSKLPRIAGTESIRFLRNSQQWQAIPIFVIASSLSTDVAKEAAEHGAFLARRSTWARDLSYFLAGVGFGPIKPSPPLHQVVVCAEERSVWSRWRSVLHKIGL